LFMHGLNDDCMEWQELVNNNSDDIHSSSVVCSYLHTTQTTAGTNIYRQRGKMLFAVLLCLTHSVQFSIQSPILSPSSTPIIQHENEDKNSSTKSVVEVLTT
uniref:Uncharacterized protein n=1 Tax=Amphimedon queenslandica TaxID=400682 RepID=A0A1X7UUT1_AMPQE